MAGRNDEQLIRDVYIKMYEGMIAKDEATLREALDDSFVLVHMTGLSGKHWMTVLSLCI